MHHHKFEEICTLIAANVPVLLTGEKGSGKTTLVMEVAKALNLQFSAISMTRQTTLSHLLGFISVNGTYIPSQLRNTADNGGLFLIDEIDAGDANVLLCLNTIENGYITFPDGVVEIHKDFRLAATSNPQDEHNHYVGRSKLDAATLDRFDIVDIDLDESLEASLVDPYTIQSIKLLRTCLSEFNSSIKVSMRDTIRFQKRINLGITDGFLYRLSGKNKSVFTLFEEQISKIPKYTKQEDCKTVDELMNLLERQRDQQQYTESERQDIIDSKTYNQFKNDYTHDGEQ